MIHVIGLPHTLPTDEFSWCAYTMKTRRFIRMMRRLGYEVNTVWGKDMGGEIPPFDPDSQLWRDHNAMAIEIIRPASKPGDYLALTAGRAQAAIAEACPELVAVEPGVGYGGICTQFRVFESYAWMHTVYGAMAKDAHAADGEFYDAVIPNAYDPDEFPRGEGGDYLLYIGRLIPRKGLAVVRDLAERVGMELHVAGAGDEALIPKGAHYHGNVGPAKRARLMGGARAVIVPTLYVEPFGGVHVEAQLCGTPVITTDWGAFVETVTDGVNGYRCRTLKDFEAAWHLSKTLDRNDIRWTARRRYGMDHVSLQYDAWFRALDTLREDGWYAT